MILGIDIGNSNIVIGYIENNEVTLVYRIETDVNMSVNDCIIKIASIADTSKIAFINLKGIIISSVVPELTSVMAEAVQKLSGLEPLIVSPNLKTGLKYSIENPEKLGCDRIADCVAASAMYPLPIVIIDFGTATTISVVCSKSVFLGGAIAPGLKMSASSLNSGTSQLPAVNIEAPNSCIGANTNDCIMSGIVFGTASMVDGMIGRIEKTLGEHVNAVATGGLAHIIVPHCIQKIILDDNLLLTGLGIIFDMNS